MIKIGERIASQEEFYRLLGDSIANKIRVALPGIIESYNKTTQTVTVQPALREIINMDGLESEVQLPLLTDVPIIFPRAGGYFISFPIQSGDECLVIFSDMCIDAWWAHGGVQGQMERRRHDLSDAFCVLGPWSQSRKINYEKFDCLQDSMVIGNEDGTAYIEIKDDKINFVGNVTINGVAF